MKRIIRNSDQTLIDVALQHAGSIERLFSIIRVNNISIMNLTKPGIDIEILTKGRVVEIMNKQVNVPATGDDPDAPQSGGIGTMKIGSTFKIA